MSEEINQVEGTTTSHAFAAGPSKADIIDVTALGGGIELISEKKVPFSMALAEELLTLTNVFGERDLRDWHVQDLLQAMIRGSFRYEHILLSKCFCEEDGKTYRTNGQHTCWARVNLPEGISPGYVKILSYKAKTLEDVRILYASTDRGAARTRGHVIAARLVGTPQFKGVGEKNIKLIASGLGFHLWESSGERSRHDADDIAYLLQTDYSSVTDRIVDFIRSATSFRTNGHMRRAPIFGAFFATFSKAHEAAKGFWSAVGDGSGMGEKNDPKLRLRNALIQNKIGGSERLGPVQEVFYRWSIVAWNAFRRGDELQVLRPNLNGKRPVAK